MFSSKAQKNTVVTWRHFDRKSYSAFRSLGREIRIGVLAVSTLTAAHTDALATRTDSLRIVKDTVSTSDLSLGEATVTGSQLPVTLDRTCSKIVVITRQDIDNARCQTVNDILKLCPNVDVRQRGAFGVQTDISLGGGTFDQITFLLNGININNPQTGHLSADFPVAIADIERIEILDGASARIFGSQALNGIINIITRIDPHNSVGLHTEAGSYGTFGGGGNCQWSTVGGRLGNRLSTDYLQSDGAVANSAFGRTRVFYQGRYVADALRLSWQAGYNTQRYGANTFYSALYPNQWEEGSRYMAALKGETRVGAVHILPTVSFTRNYDHFQLIRGSGTGENHHRTDVMSASLVGNTRFSMGDGRWSIAYGGELRHEGILSTNLGRPMDKPRGRYDHHDSRNNLSVFVEHALTWHHWSLNVGVMGNRNTAVDGRLRLYPGIDISYQPSNLKLYLSCNKSMRMPTFTDLYYKSPTQQGNVGLKPEQSTTYKLGGEWSMLGGELSLSLDGIYRRGRDMIDWVMYSPDDIYHSAAFRLSNYQVKSTATFRFRRIKLLNFRALEFSYLYNFQHRHDATPVYQSCYALDYIRHKVTASLSHSIYTSPPSMGGGGGGSAAGSRSLSATWYLRWQHREGTHLEYTDGTPVQRSNGSYALVDLKVRWQRSALSVFASLENLLNRRYYDIGTVPQPGFTVLVGVSFKLKEK